MKTAIITGTSSGLGRSLAECFLKNGFRVMGLSRSKFVDQIHHINYSHHNCDITNLQAVINFTMVINQNVDLLIHNAAAFSLQSFEKESTHTISRMIDTNLKAPMILTSNLLPFMKEGSKIFFINSVAGLEEIENQSIYCATKYGLTAFAGVLGKELKEKGIKVTSFHPGGINTPLWDNLGFHADTSKLLDPTEVAELVMNTYKAPNNMVLKTVQFFPDMEWHQ